MIYMPEMTQADLSSLLHAIAFACAMQSSDMSPGQVRSIDETAGLPVYPYAVYNRLVARSVQVEALAPGAAKVREGASSPAVLARMLQDMTPEQYAQRDRLLAGVRYLLPMEPLVDLAKQWAVDGGAFSRLDLGSWSRIHSPVAATHAG
jgi:intracellular multiplication protein IcmJ